MSAKPVAKFTQGGSDYVVVEIEQAGKGRKPVRRYEAVSVANLVRFNRMAPGEVERSFSTLPEGLWNGLDTWSRKEASRISVFHDPERVTISVPLRERAAEPAPVTAEPPARDPLSMDHEDVLWAFRTGATSRIVSTLGYDPERIRPRTFADLYEVVARHQILAQRGPIWERYKVASPSISVDPITADRLLVERRLSVPGLIDAPAKTSDFTNFIDPRRIEQGIIEIPGIDKEQAIEIARANIVWDSRSIPENVDRLWHPTLGRYVEVLRPADEHIWPPPHKVERAIPPGRVEIRTRTPYEGMVEVVTHTYPVEWSGSLLTPEEAVEVLAEIRGRGVALSYQKAVESLYQDLSRLSLTEWRRLVERARERYVFLRLRPAEEAGEELIHAWDTASQTFYAYPSREGAREAMAQVEKAVPIHDYSLRVYNDQDLLEYIRRRAEGAPAQLVHRSWQFMPVEERVLRYQAGKAIEWAQNAQKIGLLEPASAEKGMRAWKVFGVEAYLRVYDPPRGEGLVAEVVSSDGRVLRSYNRSVALTNLASFIKHISRVGIP